MATRRKTNKANKITIDKVFTLNQLETLKTSILNKYQKASDLSIELRKIEQIDLASLQFLLSLKKTALVEEKNVTIKFNAESEVNYLLNSCGFSKIMEQLNK